MSQVKAWSPLERMVQQQIVERGITDARVVDAIRATPREKFFPDGGRDQAFADRAAPIGHGQTISQPYMVALMSEKLQLTPESRVLEIGTGSGYQAAVLAKLCREVYSIERVKPLLDSAFERLLSMNVRNIHFRHADGMLGWKEAAPFDRILFTAGAPALPRDLLLEQLVDGGIAVLPIGPQDEQMLVQVTRNGSELKSVEVCPCRFVKLIGSGAWADDKD